MRIIIDGNDGVGKTWLAKRLQQDLDITSYVHLTYKDPRNYYFYLNMLKKTDVIFDRSFIDERIYSEVLGRRPEFPEEVERMLYQQVQDLNYKVIICHTKDKQLKDDEHAEIKMFEKKIDTYFKDIALTHGYYYFDPMRGSYNMLLDQLKE